MNRPTEDSIVPFQFTHSYNISKKYPTKVAYFCMEFGIDQPLKIYAGGLGFLAGSYLRSAYDLGQEAVGIGVLWKYGYYNQVRKQDQTMDVLFEEKKYGFLVDTGIKFTITISKHEVWVGAYYLPSEIFKTAPLFLLTTDLPENDYLAKTISNKLYDANPETSIAAAIVLGEGGAKLLELINWEPEIFHLNESHALPLCFHLYKKYKNLETVKNKLVYTNHTTEMSGNKKTNVALLEKMGFFCNVPVAEVLALANCNSAEFDHTYCALRMAGRYNGVSSIHKKTLDGIWKEKEDISPFYSITNGQHYGFWHDEELYHSKQNESLEKLSAIKKSKKRKLFDIVSDQCGEIYDENICTIVFAKRFTEYKRADIFFHDMDRFKKLITDTEHPVQIIWAGKPYPMDYNGIGTFDKIVDICKSYNNCSILTGYEINLSRLLKGGADVWLNCPRLFHEASGTSGMTAAMNGAVNVAIPDGWFPEFAKDKINSFIIPPADMSLPTHVQDDIDCGKLYDILEKEVLPVYYEYPNRWLEIMKNSMTDITPAFDSNRMNDEYHKILYTKSGHE